MKIRLSSTVIFTMLFSLTFMSCKNAEVIDEPKNDSFIYITQAALTEPYTIPGNYTYEEGKPVLNVPLSVYRTGLKELEAYSVSILQTNVVLAQTTKLPAEAYNLADTIIADADNRTVNFNLELNIDFLRKNIKTNYSIVLTLTDPSKYELDESLKSVKILIKTEELLKAADLYYDWELKFEDNFDGDKVNVSNWGIYNGETKKREAITVENGLLVVTTSKDKDGVITGGGMAHYSNYLFGRIEFRVRMESDPQQSVGGVILTWPKGGNWPIDGEMDIYEVAVKDNTFSTFMHYGADNSKKQYRHEVDKTVWHIMRLDWFEDVLILYRDGEKVWEITDKVVIPQVMHHLCIQAGPNLPTMGDPIKMYVDWVRIYQIRK